MKIVKRFSRKNAQGLVEYALILGLIAVVTAAIIVTIGGKTKNTLNSVSDQLGP